MRYIVKCIHCGLCISRCPQGAISTRDGALSFQAERCTNCGTCTKVCASQARVLKGAWMTAQEARQEIDRDLPFYQNSGGGVTFSGGEPLLQIDFLTEFFRQAKAAGVHTTLDTSGNPYTEAEPFYSKWLELMKYTDLVLLDIKQIDEEEHIKLTGQSNKNILTMARKLSDMGKPMWIRHVLVPGGSDKDEYLHRLADFIHTLKTVERVEVLPYHTLGVFKWEQLGIPYPLEGVRPPSEERINNAREILGEIGRASCRERV